MEFYLFKEERVVAGFMVDAIKYYSTEEKSHLKINLAIHKRKST
jgi:hypothetical protein